MLTIIYRYIFQKNKLRSMGIRRSFHTCSVHQYRYRIFQCIGHRKYIIWSYLDDILKRKFGMFLIKLCAQVCVSFIIFSSNIIIQGEYFHTYALPKHTNVDTPAPISVTTLAHTICTSVGSSKTIFIYIAL